MIVYRLERDGVGPFISRAPYYRKPIKARKLKRARHVQHQVKRNVHDWYNGHHQAVSSKYIFGAKSKELLKAYFGYNLKPYFKDGFRIKAYDVPDNLVIDMGHEVAFPKRAKKLVWLKPKQYNIPKWLTE